MHVILISLESIGLILGSMAAGMLCCWLLWSGFRLVNHPEWGPPLILIPAALALAGQLPRSEFLAMALIFASLAIIPFYREGLAWRAHRHDPGREGLLEPTERDPITPLPGTLLMTYQRYPAIAGCICEARRPNPAELKKVASRMLSETSTVRGAVSSFTTRRAALRAARAALSGTE
jgi:hypothetical protein